MISSGEKKIMAVIPTYNEGDNVEILITKISEAMPGISILIVDDNSPDKTAEKIKKAQKTYSRLFLFERPVKNGLGNAYKDAFLKIINEFSEIEIVVMMDADLSHDPKYLSRMIRETGGADLVMGSVHKKGSEISKDWPLRRFLLSKFANFYCRLIYGYPVCDWTNAYNAIKISALKEVDFNKIKSGGYAFIPALKYLLIKSGIIWKEIPTSFKERLGGKSKMSWPVVKESIISPWRLRFHERR